MSLGLAALALIFSGYVVFCGTALIQLRGNCLQSRRTQPYGMDRRRGSESFGRWRCVLVSG
jgi:hypothetical protein